jgi:hypothetical protein
VLQIVVILAGAALIFVTFFVADTPIRRSRRANDGRPATEWWIGLSITVVVAAIIANQYLYGW